MTIDVRRILVPVDFSDHTPSLLEWGAHLAEEHGSRIILLHAYHLPVEFQQLEGAYLPADFWTGVKNEADRQLGDLAEKIRAKGIEVETAVREGYAATVIVEEAAEQERRDRQRRRHLDRRRQGEQQAAEEARTRRRSLEREPQAEQQRLFENLTICLAALSSLAPLLLVLEDVHWADSGTLLLLRHLARHTHHRQVMIVATYRDLSPEEAPALHAMLLDFHRERLGTQLRLPRLDREGTEQLFPLPGSVPGREGTGGRLPC